MTDVTLTVGGQRYQGWTSLRLSRGVAQIAGGYELSVTERWAGLSTARPIKPGMTAQVQIAGLTIIQGFVDEVAPNYDAQSHTLTVSGRDATGDLVDCAAIHKPGTWSNRTLAQIAKDLAAPFNVPVKVETSVGKPFAKWSIEPGEKVVDNLDRMARQRGVLLMSDGLGNLLITQPAQYQAPAALVLGGNVLSAHGHAHMQERFSEYIVKAQQMGDDDISGTVAAAPSGTATDPAVTRYRPTIIMSEDQADAAGCKSRAAWQRTVRAAKARSIVYTVGGWLANGKPWQPNALVSVQDSFLGINESRLISQVDFYLDEQGERTELTVVGRHAFDPLATPSAPKHGGLF